jgi:hypothetical protein
VRCGHCPELSQWPHYYWNLGKHFGVECYRTWRWELFAFVLVTIFVAVLTRNWKDFSTALLATGLTLACFAIGRILRTPFLLHKSLIVENASEPHFMAGIFGIAVFAAVLIFGYELGLNL